MAILEIARHATASDRLTNYIAEEVFRILGLHTVLSEEKGKGWGWLILKGGYLVVQVNNARMYRKVL